MLRNIAGAVNSDKLLNLLSEILMRWANVAKVVSNKEVTSSRSASPHWSS